MIITKDDSNCYDAKYAWVRVQGVQHEQSSNNRYSQTIDGFILRV